MKHLIVASTTYQILSLAAAADAGRLPEGERILVLADSSRIPELTEPLQDVPGFAGLASRFTRVVDLAELVYPRRPTQFSPRQEEYGMWEKLLRSHWGLGMDEVSLYLDSVQVNPGLALADIFPDAPISAHSDGLMAYGPTRSALPLRMAQRVESLIFVNLVPGLRPQLLREHSPALLRVPGQTLRAVIAEAAAAAEPGTATLAAAADDRRTALLLGQYLAHLGLVTQEQEADLHADMLTAAIDAGAQVCIFKPHPSAGPAALTRLNEQALQAGVELVVADTPVLAEVLFELVRPDVVVGCFSTGLATAKYVFDIPTVAVGTESLLESLTPYENSNRIPLTIIDAVMNHGFLAPADAVDAPLRKDLQGLVDTVAYCMQSKNLAGQHKDAADFLSSRLGAENMRYFKRRRLLKLDLPASLPAARPGRFVPSGPKARRGAVRRLLAAMIR